MQLFNNIYDKIRTRVIPWHLILSIVIGAVSVDLFFNQLLTRQARKEQKANIALELGTLCAHLEQFLSNNLFSISDLSGYIAIHSGITKQDFESLAKIMLTHRKSLKNISVAPDFVIQYVYPTKNYKKLVGMDYRRMPEQWPQALAAKETGRMTVAGPLELIQGGTGVIARMPVFLEEDNQFWGLVSAVIDFDILIEQSGMNSKTDRLNMAIRGKDGKGTQGDIFWGDSALFEEGAKTVSSSIFLPSGAWQARAAPKNGWIKHSPYSWLIHLTVMFITGAGLAISIQQGKNRFALVESANRLKAMSEASHDALIMINGQGEITFWNPAAESMFGYMAEQMVSKDLHEILALPHEKDSAVMGLKKFSETGKGTVLNRVIELKAVRKNGEVFPAELAVAPFIFQGKWYAVGSVRDITARKEAERQLTKLATTDALTGLLSRRRFLELSEMEFRRSLRYKKCFSLMMFDLDKFKNVNDTYGHDVGDKVLRAVAETVKQALRETDVIGRIGGEEFAVIMPETDADTAIQAAERVRIRLMDTRIKARNQAIGCTVSIGLANMTDDMTDFSQLMKKADEALYAAKRGGRNRVAMSNSD